MHSYLPSPPAAAAAASAVAVAAAVTAAAAAAPKKKVIRGDDGEVRAYPVVETVQLDNVCHTTLAPARVSRGSAAQAEEAARRAVGSLWGAGVFGVELFLMKDGSVLLNEIAPRYYDKIR